MEHRFCRACGAPLNPGSKFCMKCGTPVVRSADVQEPAADGRTMQAGTQPDTAEAAQVQYAPPQADTQGAPGNSAGRKKRRILIPVLLAAVLVTFAISGVIGLVIVRQIKKHQTQGSAAFAQAIEEEMEAAAEMERDEEDSAVADAYFPEGDYSGIMNGEDGDADGMELPVPGPGERLYIGYGELEGVGLTKMAMILSEDGQHVHDISILLNDIDSDLHGHSVMFSSMQTSMTAEYTLPAADESMGESTLKEISMEGDYIHVVLDYTFTNISFGSSTEDELIPLGETEIWLKQAG